MTGVQTCALPICTGDYNGDGTSDILLQNGNTIVEWNIQNGLYQSGHTVGTVGCGFVVR